jgi:hypothetical protein
MSREPLMALGYISFLLCAALALELSAESIRRDAAPGLGPVPWPRSGAVELRRGLAATLCVLALFITAVVVVRRASLPSPAVAAGAAK